MTFSCRAFAPHGGDAQAADELHRAAVAQRAQRRTQLAARRQGVGVAAAEDAGRARPSAPTTRGACRGPARQLGQVQQRIGGAVPGADDQGPLAFEARPVGAEHVGDAVGDLAPALSTSPIAGRPLAPSGFGVPQVPVASITARARSSTVLPSCTARITNGASSRPALFTLSKPSRLTATHPGVQLQRARHLGQCGERPQHPLDDLACERQLFARRRLPAGGREAPAIAGSTLYCQGENRRTWP